jgi:hypothetical protein
MWLPIQKEKRVEFFFLIIANWMLIDEDGPKGIVGWFGFTNLNPKGFVIVTKMQ